MIRDHSQKEEPMLLEKSFHTGELTLNYAEGPASGPPLLLLHGLTGWWPSFQPLIPHLMPTWHIYACDLRGHGKSGRVADRYRVADYVQDIVTFLRQQISTPTVLLGHSLGALTALGAAADLPEHVRALVLLDPPLFVRNLSIEARPEFQGWFRWVYETTTAAQSYNDVLVRCREMAPDADETAIKAMADTVSCVAPETVSTVLHDQALEGFDLERALQHVTCPTLLIRGDWEHGSALRDEDADLVQANTPQATIVQLPKAGHLFFLEQQETTMQHVMTFLQSL
jgi:pimeloyl-ACP methyl ester carboxylesterase